MKIVGSIWVKLSCYLLLAAIAPMLAFMGDYFGAWKEDKTVQFIVPAWVWIYQGLLGVGNMALVLRTFLDSSYARHVDDVKTEEKAEAMKQEDKSNG
jgi:hypothetical protein